MTVKSDVTGSAARHSPSYVIMHRLDTLALHYSHFAPPLAKKILNLFASLARRLPMGRKRNALNALSFFSVTLWCRK